MNEQKSVWIRLLVGAFAAVVLSFVAAQLASHQIIPPLLIQAVVFGALGGAVWRWHRRRWLLMLAVGLTAFGVIGGIPFMIEDFAHPESAWGFVPACVLVIAPIVAIVSGVAALLRRSEAMARPLALGATALAVLLAVGSVIASQRVTDDAKAEGDTVIVAKRTEYPESVSLKAGDVGLYVENKDLIRHTFVIEDAQLKVELPASTGRHVAIALTSGAYEFHCDVPGHESMKGTLEVK